MVTTLNRKAKRMGRFFYGGGPVRSLAEIPTRDHDLLTGLTDDDHTLYSRTVLGDDVGATVTNSAVEGDLIPPETLPAALATAELYYHLRGHGALLNNNAAANTVRIRSYLNNVLIQDSAAFAPYGAISPQAGQWSYEAWLRRRRDAIGNTRWGGYGYITIGPQVAPGSMGAQSLFRVGGWFNTDALVAPGVDLPNIKLTAQWSVANLNLSISIAVWVIEVLRPMQV